MRRSKQTSHDMEAAHVQKPRKKVAKIDEEKVSGISVFEKNAGFETCCI